MTQTIIPAYFILKSGNIFCNPLRKRYWFLFICFVSNLLSSLGLGKKLQSLPSSLCRNDSSYGIGQEPCTNSNSAILVINSWTRKMPTGWITELMVTRKDKSWTQLHLWHGINVPNLIRMLLWFSISLVIQGIVPVSQSPKIIWAFPFCSTQLSEDYTCTGVAGSFLLRFKLKSQNLSRKEFQSW